MNRTASRVTVNAYLLAAAQRFAAVDDVRFYLNGVLVEPAPDGDGVLLVATDGHRLAVLRDRTGSTDGLAVILPRVKRPALRRGAKRPEVSVTYADGRASWSDGITVDGAAFIDGRFPDWRAILPRAEQLQSATATTVALNTDYLADLGAICDGYGASYHGARINVQDATRAAVCTFGGGIEAVVVVMPLRLEDAPTVVPEWVTVSTPALVEGLQGAAARVARARQWRREALQQGDEAAAGAALVELRQAGRRWVFLRGQLRARDVATVARLPFPADFSPVRLEDPAPAPADPAELAEGCGERDAEPVTVAAESPAPVLEDEPEADEGAPVAFLGIGQRVRYTGDMANAPGRGILVEVTGTERQPVVRIILDDGRDISIPAHALGAHLGQRFHLLPERASDIEASRAVQHAAEVAARKAAEKADAEQRHRDAVARLIAEHPHLEANPSGDRRTIGRNIRAELKRAGIKASVRMERGSMVDSFRITLPAGASDDQKREAEAIGNRFEAGHFDGMTDSYSYVRTAWGAAFGAVRYVFTQREWRAEPPAPATPADDPVPVAAHEQQPEPETGAPEPATRIPPPAADTALAIYRRERLAWWMATRRKRAMGRVLPTITSGAAADAIMRSAEARLRDYYETWNRAIRARRCWTAAVHRARGAGQVRARWDQVAGAWVPVQPATAAA